MTIEGFRHRAPASHGRRGSLVILALVSALLAGCSRPTGDFDRAAPSVVHDKLMPAAGAELATNRGEPVSRFNLTDDEQELRDRAWTLIRPPSSRDWIEGSRTELMRTRILPETSGRIDPMRYYDFLRSDRYASSQVRYDRVAADATGDAALVDPFCKVALRVAKADQERLRALGRRDISTREELAGAQARVWENKRMTEWAGHALRFRLVSYRKAIDALEIETPSGDKVWDANVAWKRLAAEVVRLEKGCDVSNRYGQDTPLRRSRIYSNWGTERPPLQK
ncbi:hypothetical protein [Stappia indica]|uniref:hypothetical protein n=1 Tax=Stappia indica TaxID=538381 RepID=UPI001CD43E97|nr:hypothetical protein [Stappia indica]MCA1300723.1 hypothetical protein [Stappia indica]